MKENQLGIILKAIKSLIPSKKDILKQIMESRPDFSQNDPESVSYIKNRPGGYKIVKELANFNTEKPYGRFLCKSDELIAVGNIYLVTLNGVTYRCAAHTIGGFVNYIGNCQKMGEYDKNNVTDEPFCIYHTVPSPDMFWAFNLDRTLLNPDTMVTISMETTVPYDKEYFPMGDFIESLRDVGADISSIGLNYTATGAGYSVSRGACTEPNVYIADKYRGDYITSIGAHGFEGYDSMISVMLPKKISSIGECAFIGCSSLTNINIPNSVTQIHNEAFYHCTSLMSIALPDSVNSIGSEAFSLCYKLTEIHLASNTPPTIYSSVFEKCSATFYVPSALVEVYKTADIWRDYANRIVGE